MACRVSIGKPVLIDDTRVLPVYDFIAANEQIELPKIREPKERTSTPYSDEEEELPMKEF
jgi:hypothetical protein